MADDDDKLPPLGDDTEKFLDDAKKGKPRSFLLICKGAKVQYLAVRKKPVKKAEVAEAKKLGYKGDAYFGVITGKGMDLVFNLPKSEYDAEPVKDKALKDFLEEHAELKSKPTFRLVDELPDIPFDDEDLQHPLVVKFMKVGEAVSKVIDARPEREAELLPFVREIRELLQEGKFDVAGPKIDALIQLLKGGTPGTPPEPTPTSRGSAGDLKAWLDKLKPECDVLLQNKVGDTTAIQSQFTAVKDKAAAKDFAGAIAICQQLANQLQSEWKQQAKAVLPRVKALLDKSFSEQSGDVQKIRAVVSLAQERAAAERFGSAAVAVAKLVPLLDAAESGSAPRESDAIPQGKVEKTREQLIAAFEKSTLVWRKTRERLEQDLAALEAAIVGLYEDHPLLNQVQSKSKRLYEVLDDLDNRLSAKLTVAAKASEREQDVLHQEALSIIAEYRTFAAKNKVMKALDTNPFLPLKTQAMLLKALDALQAALA